MKDDRTVKATSGGPALNRSSSDTKNTMDMQIYRKPWELGRSWSETGAKYSVMLPGKATTMQRRPFNRRNLGERCLRVRIAGISMPAGLLQRVRCFP